MRGSLTSRNVAGAPAGHDRIDAAIRILHLVAAPVFGVMAALNAGDQSPAMICSAGGSSMLSGMAPMYLMMAIVHFGPWLDLFKRRAERIRP